MLSVEDMRRNIPSAFWFRLGALLPIAVLIWALFHFGDRRHSGTASCHGRHLDDGFQGNSDFYGLGIRLGVYLQWVTFFIAEAALPEEKTEIAGAYAAFSIALLVALLIVIFEDGCAYTAEIIVLLCILFGGFWCVLGRRASTRNAKRVTWTALPGLEIVPVVVCLLALVIGTWFWIRMAIFGQVDFEATPLGTEFFLFARVTEQHLKQGSAFMAFFCLWILITPLLEWTALWLSTSDGVVQPFYILPIVFLNLGRASENVGKGCEIILGYLRAPQASVSTLVQLILSTLYVIVSIWFILAIELTLKWNKVEGVDDIKSTGQIIPFIIGVLSFLQVCWKLIQSQRQKLDELDHCVEFRQTHEPRELQVIGVPSSFQQMDTRWM